MIEDISQDIVTDIVRRVCGDMRADLAAWSAERIGYPSVSPQSRELFRVHGHASTSTGRKQWSIILKASQCVADSPTSDMTHAFYWKREALAYQSGLLPQSSAGLAAPRCYGVTERPDQRLWLWLEAIDEPATDPWTSAQFELAAFEVGRWGSGHRSAVPDAPWLSHGLLRAWVEDSADLIDCIQDSQVWQHPLLRDTAFQSFVPAILQLWHARDAWCTRLAQLPQTLCHHDIWRKNLLARSTSANTQQIVAIDWEVIGLGAVGEDIGNLIGVSLLNFDIDAQQAHALADALLTSYIQGLQQTEWRSDPQLVRATAQATAALRCVFSAACWPAAILRNPDQSAQFITESEQRWGRPITAIFAQWATTTAFLLAQAAQAQHVLQL